MPWYEGKGYKCRTCEDCRNYKHSACLLPVRKLRIVRWSKKPIFFLSLKWKVMVPKYFRLEAEK